MYPYKIEINIEPKYDSDAKSFLKFLQNTSKQYPFKLYYRTIRKGLYKLTIIHNDNLKLDAFFQELFLNKGLYYYACTLSSRIEIVRNVISPIIQKIFETRFERTHEKLLKRHILGRVSEYLMPGELYHESGQRYEYLFSRWNIGSLNDYDFVKDVDDLLTNFMLKYIGAKIGEKSPYFNHLVSNCANKNLFFNDREIKKAFLKIHNLRTRGLHRLERELDKEKVFELASILYNYFQYYDEYLYSQNSKTVEHDGKYYRRIKYGNERWYDEHNKPYLNENGEPYDEFKLAGKSPCGDCGVIRGQFHVHGCDIEQCPICKGQIIGCECG